MSFIAKSLFSFFSSYKNQSNTNENNNNQLQNLYRTKKTTNQTKIFSSSENENKPGIFNFNDNKKKDLINNNNYTNNEFPKKLISNENTCKINNFYRYKDSSLGIQFNGTGIIRSDSQNCVFMNITALPEYSYSSNEELRLADLEKNITGKVEYFKIKNNKMKNNNFSSYENNNKNNKGIYKNNNSLLLNENNNPFYNNALFNKQNQSKINSNSNKQDNIFTRKLDNTNSPFANLIKNNNYSNFGNNIFTSNKKPINNRKNPFENLKIINDYPKYVFPNKSSFNFISDTNITNSSTTFSSNNNINHYNNKLAFEEKTNILNNFNIDKLFSEKEKVSKVLNEAIIKEKTVRDFLYDLSNEYKSSENINN